MSLVCGFYHFARCVLKNGEYVAPHQVAVCVSKGIDVKVALEEKAKKGGYRCITLKVFDCKGGDFVENDEVSMVLVDSNTQTVLAELSNDLPLLSGPEGLYKRLEIGINNYDPSIFLHQQFAIYFFRESSRQKPQTQAGMPQGYMQALNEFEQLRDRIDHDLVAFG